MRFVLAVTVIATLLVTGSVQTVMAAVPPAFPVASVSPSAGDVVGVAEPVTITFAKAITDRAAAERSIRFTSPNTPTGAFEWLGDTVVQWKPASYWPAHSGITVSVEDFKTTFGTGGVVLGVADLDAHTFTVSIDGVVAREMPASMGKPKHPTPIGSFTALEKQSVVVMDSRTIGIPLNDPEGYKLTVNNAVRVTWGGVYVHSAPWSVASQGKANVSHGCINLSPDNAAWYFDTVSVGDPIVVQA
jgi:lipoprotein-anchoring transpeptidase ErfK/SrfK